MHATATPTKTRILESGFEELFEKGFVGFTIQGVAERIGISLGNLTYHYATREILIGAMLAHWFDNWKQEFSRIISQKIDGENPDIGAFIDWVMDNALAKDNLVFPELWAHANHDPRVAEMLETLYAEAIDTVISALNISFADEKCERLREILYMVAAVSEGGTAVLGRTTDNDPRRTSLKKHVRSVMAPLIEAQLPARH
jgi:AcrR family transcriptional regulator